MAVNLNNVNISLTVSHRPCHAGPVRVSMRHCRIDFPKRELKRCASTICDLKPHLSAMRFMDQSVAERRRFASFSRRSTMSAWMECPCVCEKRRFASLGETPA